MSTSRKSLAPFWKAFRHQAFKRRLLIPRLQTRFLLELRLQVIGLIVQVKEKRRHKVHLITKKAQKHMVTDQIFIVSLTSVNNAQNRLIKLTNW